MPEKFKQSFEDKRTQPVRYVKTEKIENIISPEQALELMHLRNNLIIGELDKKEKESRSFNFNPSQELKKISGLSEVEGRKELAALKQALDKEKTGLANVQTEILALVRRNKSLTPIDLYEKTHQLCRAYNISRSGERAAYSAAEEYLQSRQKIDSLKEQCPNCRNWFNYIFGQPPQGRVEVKQGPINIHFKIFNLDDYILAYTGGNLENKNFAEQADKTGGANINYVFLRPELAGLITIERADKNYSKEWSNDVFQHEEQHSLEDLIKEKFRPLPSTSLFLEFSKCQNESTKRLLLQRYFRQVRENPSEFKAKHEILSFSKGSYFTDKEIYNYLTALEEDGGIYDFSKKQKEGCIKNLIEEFGAENAPLIEEVAQEIFVDEYQKLIKNGLEAFTAIKAQGYDSEWITAFLTQEPLPSWHKAVKRHLAEKLKKAA